MANAPTVCVWIEQVQYPVDIEKTITAGTAPMGLLQMLKWIAAKYKLFGQRSAKQHQEHGAKIGQLLPAPSEDAFEVFPTK